MNRIFALMQIQFDIHRLRIPGLLFYGAILPVVVYRVAKNIGGDQVDAAHLTAGALLLSSTTIVFRYLGLSIASDRDFGRLALLGTTPLTKGHYLSARCLEALVMAIVPFFAVHVWGRLTGNGLPLSAFSFFAYAMWALTLWSGAVCIIGTLRSSLAFQLLRTFSVMIPTLFPFYYPANRVPSALARIEEWLPPTLALDLLEHGRGTFAHGALLGGWTVGLSVMAVAVFRWED